MGFWRKDFTDEDIQRILEKCRELRSVGDDGSVTFKGLHHRPLTAMLVSAVGFDARTEALKAHILQKTLASPDLPNDFTEKDFRDIAWKLKDGFQNHSAPHRVVFPIWNKPAFLDGRRRIGPAMINFSPSDRTPLFKRIERERAQQRSWPGFCKHFGDTKTEQLDRCSLCVVRVAAHTHHDAYELASDALYGILGLVNMAADGGKGERMTPGPNLRPVSDVLIGPHVTVHADNGALAFQGFWYENWPDKPPHPFSDAELDGLESDYGMLARGAAQSPWSAECRSASVRYFKAFSNPNLHESLLDGWRLMEHVAGSRTDSIKQKLTRVSNAAENRVWWRIVGKHLQARRNMITHGAPIGIQDQEQETLAFQMRGFIRPYLLSYILNTPSLATQEEFWEMLEITDQQDKRVAEESCHQRRVRLLHAAADFYRPMDPV